MMKKVNKYRDRRHLENKSLKNPQIFIYANVLSKKQQIFKLLHVKNKTLIVIKNIFHTGRYGQILF